MVARVSAPRRISPPPFGTSSATSTAYSTVPRKLARFWRSKRCCPMRRLLKSPSGKRAAIETTTRKVEIRAGQTRSSGASTRSGTSQASTSPTGSVTSADHAVERETQRRDRVRVLGRLPAARGRGEADDGGADAEVEDGEVDRDGADERPDPEGVVPDRVEHDRRDDEARDDRRRRRRRRSRGRSAGRASRLRRPRSRRRGSSPSGSPGAARAAAPTSRRAPRPRGSAATPGHARAGRRRRA